MSFLKTLRDDLDKLAGHTLDLGKFTAQIEAKVISEMEAFKAEIMSRVDKMLSDLKSEIMGGVEAQASKAVAALGTEVASITGGAVSDLTNSVSQSGPVADPAAQPDPTSTDSAPTAPVVTTDGTATITVVPAASTAHGTDPLTGNSVAPGMTAHSDTSTGVATMVPHNGSAPTAVVANSGAAVQPDPAVVQVAVTASAAAGVDVKPAS